MDSQLRKQPHEAVDVTKDMRSEDAEFLHRAIALVEQNMNSSYSVEQLSRDLCMERTGLYKRLSALIDQSPSLFMRSIRLRRAAELIKEGSMTITEVAEATGFSSASYLSRCFQEEYGCKPSEYRG
jgi:transcriptional regulator GlxA family with amidase domain